MEKAKETPINFRVYYNNMQHRVKEGINNIEEKIDKVYDDLEVLASDINKRKDELEGILNTKLSDFPELQEERYIDGRLYYFVTGKLLRCNNNKEKDILTPLVLYVNRLQYLNNLTTKLSIYRRCADLSIKEYTEYLRTYYTEIQKKLIKEGAGYLISRRIGWLCINRVKNTRVKPVLDYKKTAAKKKEILERGGRIYNDEEAKWCAAQGLDYNYEEHRVYQDKPEYIYEIPLLDTKLPRGNENKFTTSDYRAAETRGLSNEQIIEKCHNNVDEILNQKLDVRLKLNLCLSVDKSLYVKYIRNENQESVTTRKARS